MKEKEELKKKAEAEEDKCSDNEGENGYWQGKQYPKDFIQKIDMDQIEKKDSKKNK